MHGKTLAPRLSKLLRGRRKISETLGVRFRHWLRYWRVTQKRRRQLNERKPRFEELVVFCEIERDIFRVRLPIDDLYKNLGARARFVCDTSTPQYVGAGLAYLAAVPVIALPIFLLGYDIIMSTVVGVLLASSAALPGWIVGPKFGPKPQWLSVRREDGTIAPFDINGYYSPSDPEASFIAEMMQMRDLRMVLSGGQSRQQKLQIALFVVLLVCLVIALFFFVTVLEGCNAAAKLGIGFTYASRLTEARTSDGTNAARALAAGRRKTVSESAAARSSYDPHADGHQDRSQLSSAGGYSVWPPRTRQDALADFDAVAYEGTSALAGHAAAGGD